MKNLVHTNWKKFIDIQAKEQYWSLLSDKVNKARENGIVFPSQEQIFNCFNFFNVEDTKVVILGQDPYHGPGQANGLAFSVNKNVKLPRSLANIFSELKNDLNVHRNSGNLEHWAKQGVLLLNSCLTVDSGKPNSHNKFGWDTFTDNVIMFLNEHCQNIVYILWGNFAKSKSRLINKQKNFVFKSVHPPPFSAHTGFLVQNLFPLLTNI